MPARRVFSTPSAIVWLAVAAATVLVSSGVPATSQASDSGWHAAPSLPEARAFAGVAALDGRLYVVGGWGPMVAGNTSIETSVEAYDPQAHAWESAGDLPRPLRTLTVAASAGSLYAFGCVNPCGPLAQDVTTSVLRRDPETGAWTPLSQMPRARWAGLATTGWGGRIWNLGGISPTAPSAPRRAVDVYVPVTNSWVSRAPLPRGFRALATARTSGGRPLVFGAFRFSGLITLGYSRRLQGWVDLGAVTVPTGEWSPAGISATAGSDGRIYVIGGYTLIGDAATPSNAELIYNPVTRHWSVVQGPATKGGSPGVAALADEVFVVGGFDDFAGPVDTVLARSTPAVGPN
jgi:N-acetylneuraminic acid mutarotase